MRGPLGLCPVCGVRARPWCERWCMSGTLCPVHTGLTSRHPLAPSPAESRAAGRRYLRALEKRPMIPVAEDARIQAAHAAAAADDRDDEGVAMHGAAVKAALAAAQVAALTADTGAGQTVVMAPPDVRPIPAPIGVLRDELMRTLK